MVVERRLGQLGAAQLLDDLARHAVLAQLRLHHAPPARRVPVTLLRPPARECAIVEVAQRRQPLDGALHHRVLGAGAARRRSSSQRVRGRAPR